MVDNQRKIVVVCDCRTCQRGDEPPAMMWWEDGKWWARLHFGLGLYAISTEQVRYYAMWWGGKIARGG